MLRLHRLMAILKRKAKDAARVRSTQAHLVESLQDAGVDKVLKTDCHLARSVSVESGQTVPR